MQETIRIKKKRPPYSYYGVEVIRKNNTRRSIQIMQRLQALEKSDLCICAHLKIDVKRLEELRHIAQHDLFWHLIPKRLTKEAA